MVEQRSLVKDAMIQGYLRYTRYLAPFGPANSMLAAAVKIKGRVVYAWDLMSIP